MYEHFLTKYVLSSSRDWTIPPQYLYILDSVRVLILGPYYKGRARRLKAIRSSLIDKGVRNCRLVLDFNTPPKVEGEKTYDLRKSEYWINQADLLLFIFLDGKYESGVAMELKHATDTKREYDTIVAYPEKKAAHISSLIGQYVSRYDPAITQIKSNTRREIVDKTLGVIVSKLETIYTKVSHRAAGEWELSTPSS